MLQVEASSFCQLRCPSCPTTAGAIDAAVGRGFLRAADFDRLLADNPDVRAVELSNYGEIFLNPELPQLLECAFRRNVAVSAGNGVNLNNARDDALEAVVRWRMHTITVSIDGASADTYRQYRVGGDFDRVIRHVERINHFRQVLGSSLPNLRWQFVIFGHNQHEIVAAQRMATTLGMTFVPKLSWDDEVSPPDPALVRRLFGVANRAEYREKHGQDYVQGICHQLWDSPQINWNGSVLGCCRNFWGTFGGNAFQDGLAASLNTGRLQQARKMLLGRTAPQDGVPCTTCEIYQHMRSSGRFLQRDEVARGQVLTAAEALAIGADREAAGRRADAEAVYRGMLKAWPGHVEATQRLAALVGG